MSATSAASASPTPSCLICTKRRAIAQVTVLYSYQYILLECRHVCYECGKCFPYAKLLNMHKETRHSSGIPTFLLILMLTYTVPVLYTIFFRIFVVDQQSVLLWMLVLKILSTRLECCIF
jgi:hypothetical protein